MKEDYRSACLLYAKLPAFEYKVKRARATIRKAVELQDIRWYIAFSGGKDSQVVLDMVLHDSPSIAIMWGDDGWDYPETLTFLADVESRRGVRIERVKNRGNIAGFAAWAGRDWQGENPGPWDYECTSFDDHSRLIHKLGFDGVFLGLRKEESVRRFFSLVRFGPLHWTKGEQIWHCSPLHDWTTMDVWAYILSHKLEYNPVYDKLSDLGIKPEYQRVGPLISWGEDCYATLKRGWPDLFNHFAAEFPEMRCYV